MTITRDVVRDLWPLYAANEASPDTRAVVDEFLRNDPELREQLSAALELERAAVFAPRPDESAERRALTMTKQTLRRERLFLAGGAAFALIPLAITMAHLNFERWGVTSAFRRLPEWENYFALACLAASLACWLAWFSTWRRLRFRSF